MLILRKVMQLCSLFLHGIRVWWRSMNNRYHSIWLRKWFTEVRRLCQRARGLLALSHLHLRCRQTWISILENQENIRYIKLRTKQEYTIWGVTSPSIICACITTRKKLWGSNIPFYPRVITEQWTKVFQKSSSMESQGSTYKVGWLPIFQQWPPQERNKYLIDPFFANFSLIIGEVLFYL